MSETTELKTAVDVEVRGYELLHRLTRELDTFIAKAKQAVAATSGKMAGYGTDMAKGQDRANDAVRRGLGLRVQAERQRTDAAKAERQDAIAFDSNAVRMFRMRMRMQRDQAREAAASDRARETAARTAERQAERASRAVEAATVRRARAEANEGRRREREARTAERDRERSEARQERDNAAAVRRAINLDNWRFALRSRMQRQEAAESERHHREMVRHGREAWRHGRDGLNGTIRPAGAAAAIGIGGAVAATRRVLRAETDTDTAEINARAYGGLDAKGARELRDQWAAPTAEALGVPSSKLMESWTDATKLGIPAKDAKGFAELATKTSEAWGVPFQTVVDTLGTMNTLLTAKGEAFDLGKLQSAANAMQYLAAKQSTTPEKLISFLARGAGGGDLLGMSMEGTVAFGSASTSLGNQAGQSGSLLDYIAGRVIEMPRLSRQKGREGDQARDLMRRLGYGSADNMERIRKADPDAFLPDLVERFNKIQDPKKRNEAIRFFTGREWLGEFGRMVNGPETYREAQKLAKESKSLDAIGDVWNLHKLKLTFVAKQFTAGWLNILGEFGKELSPLARQAGDFFLEWTGKLRAGGLKDRFRALLDGLMEGLGVKSFPDLLRNIFGDPKSATGGSIEGWKAAAKGFGEGIRDVVGTILGVAKMFTGGSTDPEKLGKLTAQVLGFGLALVMISPFVSVIGAIGSALLGLAYAASMAWKVIAGVAGIAMKLGRTLGIVPGGVPSAPPGGVPEAGGAAKGGMLGRLGRALMPAWIAQTLGLPKADQDAMVKRLGKWAQDQDGGKGLAEMPAPSSPWADLDALRERLHGVDPALAEKVFPGGGTVQRQSFDGDDWRGLIHPAALSSDVVGPREWREHGRDLADGFLDRAQRGLGGASTDRSTDAVERLQRTMATMGNRAQLAGLNPALAGAAGAAIGGSAAGYGGGSGISPSDPAQRYGKRFFSIPGGGGGSASSNPANSAASAAMLDAIAGTESGKAGYDAVLGNGKYGTPDKPVSTMTLDEAFRFGRQIKARHGSSSALGRYQIVGNTMRAAQEALGIPGTATFDQAMQDRMARWIARNQGLGAWEGLKSNPRAMAAARAAMAQGGAQDVPAGSQTASVANALPGREQYEGLRLKSLEAIAGGAVAQGVTDLARQAQGDLPGGVARFTAFNDRYHQGTRSKHAAGLAFDTVLQDASRSREAAAAMRAKLAAAGLDASQYKVIDEYLNPSSRSTGGHIHTQFNTAEAAKRYHDYLGATPEMVAKAKQGGKPVISAPDDAPPSDAARAMVRNVPLPPQRPAGLGGSGGQGAGGVVVHNHINGWEKSPKEIADMAQKATTEAWNHRAHDLEPELT